MEEIKILLSSGLFVYIIKSVVDFYIRKKELRNNTFYEAKTKKVLELHKKIIDIQIMIDRGTYPLNQIHNLSGSEKKSTEKIRFEMDIDYWESSFYYSKATCKYLKELLSQLIFFSTPDYVREHPSIKTNIQKTIIELIKCLKKEIQN